MAGLTIKSEPVPLRADTDGTVRIGETRITLDLIVSAFLDGASAEEIVEQFPTLPLADVYSVLGFYLNHRVEVDTYLDERKSRAEEIRSRVESKLNRSDLRQRLLARQTS